MVGTCMDTHLVFKSTSYQREMKTFGATQTNHLDASWVFHFPHGCFSQTAEDMEIHSLASKADRPLQSSLAVLAGIKRPDFPCNSWGGRRAFHMSFPSMS